MKTDTPSVGKYGYLISCHLDRYAIDNWISLLPEDLDLDVWSAGWMGARAFWEFWKKNAVYSVGGLPCVAGEFCYCFTFLQSGQQIWSVYICFFTPKTPIWGGGCPRPRSKVWRLTLGGGKLTKSCPHNLRLFGSFSCCRYLPPFFSKEIKNK